MVALAPFPANPVSLCPETSDKALHLSLGPHFTICKTGGLSRGWRRLAPTSPPMPRSSGPLYRSCQCVGAISCFKYKIGSSIIYAHLIAYERSFCDITFSSFMDLVTVMSCF